MTLMFWVFWRERNSDRFSALDIYHGSQEKDDVKSHVMTLPQSATLCKDIVIDFFFVA